MSSIKIASAAVAAIAATVSMTAYADDFSKWEVRGRVVRVDTADGSDAFTAGPVAIPEKSVNVHGKTIPEVDISYFFTKNIAAELILTYPQTLDVTVDSPNLGGIGSVKALPPTLTGQYHFLPDGNFDPYVGAGLNLTIISSVHLVTPAVPGALPSLNLDTGHFEVGPAIQLGFDYKVDRNWVVNLDAKYVWLSTDLKLNDSKITTLHLDPWLFGIGVGYKF